MTPDAEQYWREFEKTTGERVEAKAMGQWLNPPSQKEGMWGLLVLTDCSFHFMGQKSGTWLAGLFNLRGRADADSVKFAVPKDDLLSLEEPRNGIWGRLMGSAFPRISISWRSVGEAGEGKAVFEVDDKSGFTQALRKAMPGLAAGNIQEDKKES